MKKIITLLKKLFNKIKLFFNTDLGKKIKKGLLVLLAVIISVVSVRFRITARETGEKIGTNQGILVGNALGSWDGITHGIQDGTEAGREAGLNATDFTTQVKTTLESSGKLQVLSANVHIGDKFEIEDSYRLFFTLQGKAVFTVDLSTAETITTDDTLTVLLDQPEVTFIKDLDKTYKIAEKVNSKWWQKKKNAQDVIKAYINTLNNIDNEINKLSNYRQLKQEACNSAIRQVENLIGKMKISDVEVVIIMKEN